MVHIIRSVKDLEALSDKDFILIGEGWLYELYLIFFREVIGKEPALTEEDLRIIVVAGQEDDCRKESERLDDEKKEIFYCTNQVKNEIDALVMNRMPKKYEQEVLFARKKELDEKKSIEYRHEIERKTKDNKIPLFESIEIETLNRCNGRCDFCPVNKNDDIREYHKMDEKLYHSIIDQLEVIHYEGRVALFSNNEPLLDKRIVQFAEYAFMHIPQAFKTIFTNGTLINDEIFFALIRYMDLICFDIYYDENPIKEITSDMRSLLIRILSDKDVQKKVMVQYINRRAIRNNRGGLSSNRHAVYKVQSPCMLPFFQMIVRPDGKTSLCCNDPYGRMNLADLNKERISDAWNNEEYQKVRKIIMEGRQNMPICRDCDNFGSLNLEARNVFSDTEITGSWEKTERLIKDYH